MTRTVASSFGLDARNTKWTSYGALELDVFAPRKEDFELFLAAMKPIAEIEFARDLSQQPGFKPDSEVFSEARALFNAERYWECHEALEGVWRRKQGEEKPFLQGLILVCAAFVHHQKGEDAVALGILSRASKQVAYRYPNYGGVNVAKLRANVGRAIESKRFLKFLI